MGLSLIQIPSLSINLYKPPKPKPNLIIYKQNPSLNLTPVTYPANPNQYKPNKKIIFIMVSSFFIVHLPFVILPVYFIFYTISRLRKHWSDGKEPAKTSNSRFAAKLILTFLLSLLDIVHIADYSPNQHYSPEEIALRIGFYTLSALAWLFSAILVFFDLIRRLKCQWRGQRIYWILELASHIVILVLNTSYDHYEYSGKEFYTFTLIQIASHALSVLFCLILSYFSLFRPNDFTVLTSDIYINLHSRASNTEDSIRDPDSEISLKITFLGFKTKLSDIGTSVPYYKFRIKLNNTQKTISRTLQDFEILHNSFLNSSFNLVDLLPHFESSDLIKFEIQERGLELCSYLNSLCKVEFMSGELLTFLMIDEGEKDLLTRRFLEFHEERNESHPVPRSQSICLDYFSHRLDPGATDSVFVNSTSLQWLVSVKVLRPDREVSKDVDFLLWCEIPQAGFKKTVGYRLAEFSRFLKTVSKVLAPASIYFNSNIPRNVKSLSESSIFKLQSDLEHYMIELLNDPAFLCKEALEFIKCDLEVSDLLTHLPSFQYQIKETATWENLITEEHSHVTMYRIWINQRNLQDLVEKEWQFLRRYREFDLLQNRLTSRQRSPILKSFASRGKIADLPSSLSLPNLPNKGYTPLSTSSEIENRKQGLVNYLKELCLNPLVVCSYAFREFLDSGI